MAAVAPTQQQMEPPPEGPIDAVCLQCEDASCDFKPVAFKRRAIGDFDVLIDMKYCGICHTDLHYAADHMKKIGGPLKTVYPITPGHELAGVCIAVGPRVTKFKPGDHVGVGCMVDACLNCKDCKKGEEQKCLKQVGTYNADDHSGRAATFPEGGKTKGGYSTKMVVTERFGIKLPQEYPLEAAGPVMCAGITMYDPLKAHGATAGTRVGIIGLGGLGVMGVKLAKAMGCKVSAISRSTGKRSHASEAGAETFIVSTDPADLGKNAKTLDLILNTIPVEHDWSVYNSLLSKSGKQVLLGLHSGLVGSMAAQMIVGKRNKVIGSGIGGTQNTQEVIDLCAKHDIKPDITVVSATEVGSVYEKLDKNNDSGVRYVLDISTLDLDKEKYTAPPPQVTNPPHPISCGACCSVCCGTVCRVWCPCCCMCRK
eukprot:TRINITY_DN1414_c0_g2_i1.p1 TRINITY_DN1414_c0_g2~~TRINITY_DN1414_c0_g2_i1.p1  ORF type:complete len:426 (+),score=76.44 TRINITY_DN1414_c0_g2_i1:99-1376(+)